MTPRPGTCFRRDVRALLESRERELAANDHIGFPANGGLGLVWLAPWPEGEQIRLSELDIWFVEICRRVRLRENAGTISAVKGTSKAARIDAKAFKGVLGDPYAPVHKTEGTSLTLNDGDFDFRRVNDLLLSGEWRLPVLTRPASFDRGTLMLECSALSRGNNKTDGFKTRSLPLSGEVAQAIGPRQAELFELARDQIAGIDAAKRRSPTRWRLPRLEETPRTSRRSRRPSATPLPRALRSIVPRTRCSSITFGRALQRRSAAKRRFGPSRVDLHASSEGKPNVSSTLLYQRCPAPRHSGCAPRRARVAPSAARYAARCLRPSFKL